MEEMNQALPEVKRGVKVRNLQRAELRRERGAYKVRLILEALRAMVQGLTPSQMLGLKQLLLYLLTPHQKLKPQQMLRYLQKPKLK